MQHDNSSTCNFYQNDIRSLIQKNANIEHKADNNMIFFPFLNIIDTLLPMYYSSLFIY